MDDPFRHAFEASTAALAVVGADGTIEAVNAELCAISGFPREALVGQPFRLFSLPDDGHEDHWPALARGEMSAYSGERRYVGREGTLVLGITVTAVPGASGPAGFVVHVEDRTRRRQAEEDTRAAEDRFTSAFEFAPIGMAIVGLDGGFLRVNPSLCRLIGRPESELLRKRFQDLTHPDDLHLDLALLTQLLDGQITTYEMDKRYARPDGSFVWVQLNVSLARHASGAPQYFISQIQDISLRRSTEAELRHHNRHDALTGLANRTHLLERLAAATTADDLDAGERALLFLDLDDFKRVNDDHGHAAGDELLVEVGTRLARVVRGGDVVARFGGDEFAVLAAIAPGDDAGQLSSRIERAVKGPLRLSTGAVIEVGVSVGIELVDGRSAAVLLARADAGMYAAKRSRRVAG